MDVVDLDQRVSKYYIYMYSNQKDQINLESTYSKVHNNTLNEDANESITAVSVVYSAMVLIPLLVQFLKNKYGSSFDVEEFSQKINSFMKNENIKKDLEHQGLGYVKSNIISMLKNTKGITKSQEDASKDVQNIIPDENNQSLIQKAKSWLKNTISNQEMQNMQNRVKRGIEVNRPLRSGFRG